MIELNETIKHKIRKQQGAFLDMFLGILGASILGNMLPKKGVMRVERGAARARKGTVRAGKGVVRARTGYNSIYHMNKNFKFLLHALSNIEIIKYFNYNPRFNGFFSRDNLPRIKDGEYEINLIGKKSNRKHWSSLFIDRNTLRYLIFLELNMFIFLKKY